MKCKGFYFLFKMISFPNAKVNLGLIVAGKRKDGFHDIETVYYPVAFCDALEIIPSKCQEHSFHYSGLKIPGSGKNICEQAVELLSENYDFPAIEMHLHKHIPMGAGLGGGSADAAFCLQMMSELFDLAIPHNQLMQMAAELGSDCPFFIRNEAVYASGRGNVFSETKLDLKGYHIRIVKPDISVSTAEAYRNIKAGKKKYELQELIENTAPSQWKGVLVNDFEDYVFGRFPEIRKIKEQLYEEGAVYASMSGSGTALYALFREAPAHCSKLEKYFVWDGFLG